MARYGKKTQSKVRKAMKERKAGTLKSGRSGRKVKSRKQAIAIGLSEARRTGGKVPKKRASRSGTSRTRSAAKKKGGRRATARKRTTAKRSTSKRTTRARKKK